MCIRDRTICFAYQDLETEFWVAGHKAIVETLTGLGVKVIETKRIYTGGDILVALDDTPLRSLEQLEAIVESEYVVGAEVTLTLLRNGQEMTVTFTLVEEPGS